MGFRLRSFGCGFDLQRVGSRLRSTKLTPATRTDPGLAVGGGGINPLSYIDILSPLIAMQYSEGFPRILGSLLNEPTSE
ncbi:hypothetical protein HC766_07025 [Candidatus Gracilibacteria bacterium]|nr:hypothetical protein [Candidatus Gracilibacteria bacterium]